MTNTLDEPSLKLLEEHVRRLLVAMGFTETTVRCRHLSSADSDQDYQRLIIEIEAGETGRLLIGVRGTHLQALQHIIRCLLRPHLTQRVQLTVDVNGYLAKWERNIARVAEAAAKKATTQGQTVVLKPMNAANRRLIHTALAVRDDIKTESMGEEPNRRVVVKPIFL